MSNPQGSKSSTPSTNTDNSKSTTSTNQPTSSSNTSNGPDPFSRYRFIKDGWGRRSKFQASYGLDMSPDGIDEGNVILEALMKQDPAKK
ncbi:MAG: hypothetical protein M1835_004077 [Candelina submexicana]|nr:MAG: hypothetical protein M1835_004077 [Candelina submexicana]